MNSVGNIVVKKMQPVDGERKSDPALRGKQLIVEFVGPAGSGKTTNCLHFANLLRNENLTVYVFGDIKEYLYQLGLCRRFNVYLNALLSNGLSILSFAYILTFNGVYSIDSIYRYTKLCVFNAVLQQFMKTRKVDLVLLDQWVIQGLWSATIFKTGTHGRFSKLLKRFYFKTSYVLYFDIDEETACQRIGSRTSGRSRFDRMKKEKRLAEMKKYNRYLHELFANSDCRNKMTFSTKVKPGKNAEAFSRHLEHAINEDIK